MLQELEGFLQEKSDDEEAKEVREFQLANDMISDTTLEFLKNIIVRSFINKSKQEKLYFVAK